MNGMTKWSFLVLGLFLGFLLGWFFFKWMPTVQAFTPVEDCPAGSFDSDSSSPYTHDSVPAGYIINKVCIDRTGQEQVYTANETDGCYTVAGIGTATANVSANNNGCKQNTNYVKYYKTPAPTVTPTPTMTPTPTVTPTPDPVCEQEEWSCESCQKLNDDICYEKQQSYCEKYHGCFWNEVCEVNGDFKKVSECYKEWVCEDVCEPEVTPTPTPETKREDPKPEGCTSNCGVPACTDRVPKEVANPHVYRKGDCAIVKWYPTEGDKANIYWKENSSGGWQHSLANVENTGWREVCGLGNMDITFGVQSVNGCAADGIVNASNILSVVDGATSGWVLFR